MYNIIRKLEETPGMNDKLDILREKEDNEELKYFFKLALDPMIIFGIKKIPKYDHLKELCDLTHGMNLLVDMLATRKATGNVAYLKTLKNWLKEEIWKDILIGLKKNKNKPNKNVNYGGKLI